MTLTIVVALLATWGAICLAAGIVLAGLYYQERRAVRAEDVRRNLIDARPNMRLLPKGEIRP